MIPFSPQSVEQLRARLPAAIEHVYTLAWRQRFPAERPGAKLEHVFDLRDGTGDWRVIVSVDQTADGLRLHASVSRHGDGVFTEAQAQTAFAQVWGPGVLRVLDSFATERAVHFHFEWPTRRIGGGR